MRNQLPRVKWPHTFPICTIFGIVCALLATAGSVYVQCRLMPPIQRYYVPAFVKSILLPMKQNVRFIEVYSRDAQGYVMAVDPWIAVKRDGKRTAFYLTDDAVAQGLSRPRFFDSRGTSPKVMRAFLERSVYHRTLIATFRPTVCVFAIVLALGILIGAWLDQKHQEAARRGVQIRGPKMMTPPKARRYLKGDGIALFLDPKPR